MMFFPVTATTPTTADNDIPKVVRRADELLSPASLIKLSTLVGTNGQLSLKNDRMVFVLPGDWTNSGQSASAVSDRSNAAAAIEELRGITNLPLTTLANLLGVERRSVYFWIEGRPISTDNQTRLEALRSLARRLDRGEPSRTAEALVAACKAPDAPAVGTDRLAGYRAVEGQAGAQIPQLSVAALLQKGDDRLVEQESPVRRTR